MNSLLITPLNSEERAGLARLISDLDFVFQDPRWFSLKELLHLKQNFHRLVRHTYQTESGTGCIFGLLTENRTGDRRITSRETLTCFFTGGWGKGYRDLPVYQPARWIVRAWDRQSCARYSGVTLSRATLREALDWAIKVRAPECLRLQATFASTALIAA